MINSGIDLNGRKMKHIPWPIHENGIYRTPSNEEIANTYGISGRTLKRYFNILTEENKDNLITQLSKHFSTNYTYFDVLFVNDESKYYTNEFYFYFINFIKRELNDYNFCIIPEDGKELDICHKIYENGFLSYIPFGDGVDDVTNAINVSLLGCFAEKIDRDEILRWIDCLTQEKCGKKYSDYAEIENFMLSSEIVFYVYEFIKIQLNFNNFMDIIDAGFTTYNMNVLSFAPESVVLSVLERVIGRTANTFDIELEKKKNGVVFCINRKKTFDMNKLSYYQRSIDDNVCKMFISAYKQVLKRILDLPEYPTIRLISKDYMIYDFSFEYSWDKREILIPLKGIGILSLIVTLLLVGNSFVLLLNSIYIIVISAFILIVLLWRRSAKYYSNRSKHLEEKLISLGSEYEKQFQILKTNSSNLISEKNNAVNRLRITEIYTRSSIVNLITNGQDPTKIEPEKKSISVIFSDIKDFTKISESREAIEIVNLLNSYFDKMNKCIMGNNGEVDKLIGDCIMALFFNSDSALKAAIEMRRSLDSVNKFNNLSGLHRISNGIGINFGEVIMGNIGSASKMDYTVIGDIVNSANRLEALTRYYGTEIIISEEFKNQLKDSFEIQFIDNVLVKGKKEPTKIFEVIDYLPPRIKSIKRQIQPHMDKAYNFYESGNFNAAIKLYGKIQEKVGRHKYEIDKCANPIIDFYLNRCIVLKKQQDNGFLEDWNGVYEFLTK